MTAARKADDNGEQPIDEGAALVGLLIARVNVYFARLGVSSADIGTIVADLVEYISKVKAALAVTGPNNPSFTMNREVFFSPIVSIGSMKREDDFEQVHASLVDIAATAAAVSHQTGEHKVERLLPIEPASPLASPASPPSHLSRTSTPSLTSIAGESSLFRSPSPSFFASQVADALSTLSKAPQDAENIRLAP